MTALGRMSGWSVKPHNCPHSSAHQPLTQNPHPRRPAPRIVSYSITPSIRGTQIPIVRDQPPSSHFPRFPPLEVFRRRPPMRAAPSVSSRHPKTFTHSVIRRCPAQCPVCPKADTARRFIGAKVSCRSGSARATAPVARATGARARIRPLRPSNAKARKIGARRSGGEHDRRQELDHNLWTKG